MKTIKDWKKEYYPITAKQAAKGSMLKAVNHSLKKWNGLSKKTLEEHGLHADFGMLMPKHDDTACFLVDASSCALCEKYFRYSFNHSCEKCPLYLVRGHIACYETRGNERESPYTVFEQYGDPKPMIKWLKKAQAYAINSGEE